MRKRSVVREIAKNKYQELVRSGTPLSLSEFSRRSIDLVGHEVPESSAIFWAHEDRWNDVEADSIDAAGEVKPIILKTYHNVLSSEDPVDISNYARAFSKIVGTLDPRIRSAFNGMISDVMGILRVTMMKDNISSSRISMLSTTWSVLNRFTDVELPTDDEGINPDGILFGLEPDN